MDTLIAQPVPAFGGGADLEALIREHRPAVVRSLRRVLGFSREEEDLVQEVFTRLTVRLRQPGEVVAGAWLRMVAHNVAVDEARRRRPVPVEEIHLDRAVASEAESGVLEAELYATVAAGLHRLPERQRVALEAQLGGAPLDGAALASRLGVSVHAAESVLARARRRLRVELAGLESEAGRARGGVLGAVAAALAGLGALRRARRAAAVALAAAAAVGTVAVNPDLVAPGRPPAASVPAPAPAAGRAPADPGHTSSAAAGESASPVEERPVEAGAMAAEAEPAPGHPSPVTLVEGVAGADLAGVATSPVTSVAVPEGVPAPDVLAAPIPAAELPR